MLKRPATCATFNDSSCELVIRGYKLVPNDALSTKIAVYLPEAVAAILSDHPEIVDSWLNRLHEKYLTLKKSCEFDGNPVACFNMPPFQQFEKHFQSWREGGVIAISVESGSEFRIRNEKRGEKTSTIARAGKRADLRFMCSKCSTAFADSEEYAKHLMREIDVAKDKHRRSMTQENDAVEEDIPPNPIWWLSYS